MNHPSILVVEGDAETRARYAATLSGARFAVEECEDGAEALGRAICHPPDAIVMATRIRRIDGFALCQLLRADAATRAVPIIAVTASQNPGDRPRAIRAGATAVMVPPFDLQEMAAAVREQLTASPRPLPPPPAPPADPQIAARAAHEVGRSRFCKSRTFKRDRTTAPPLAPPVLRCPLCNEPLAYKESYLGGVNDRSPEQWDYFSCDRCGFFQYRHRTRKLRAVS